MDASAVGCGFGFRKPRLLQNAIPYLLIEHPSGGRIAGLILVESKHDMN